MTIVNQFGAELHSSRAQQTYHPAFLPEVITKIVVGLLPISGASLSLVSNELRMPLAASDEQSRGAEAAQFTLGDGPCLDTFRTNRTQSFTEAGLAARWPLYLTALIERTAFRAVTSIPLDLGSHLVGALDLYLTNHAGLSTAALVDAHQLAAVAADALNSSPHADDADSPGPFWLHNTPMQQRASVWVAIGITTQAADVTAADALDLIRSYAWAHDTTVDDISHQLTTQTLTSDQLLQT